MSSFESEEGSKSMQDRMENCLSGLLCRRKRIDLDDIFPFITPKKVIIRDCKLGLSDLMLKIAIFIYIFLISILYKGRHLSSEAAFGVGRMFIEHPVSSLCRSSQEVVCDTAFRPPSELPYCSDASCTYLTSLQLPGNTLTTGESLFIPTSIAILNSTEICTPQESNNFTCSKVWPRTQADDGAKSFVADIESFNIFIDHAFEAFELKIRGVARQYQGFWSSDSGLRSRCPVPCLHESDAGMAAEDKCAGQAQVTCEDFPSVRSEHYGDRISVRDLMKLADTNPNDPVELLDRWVGDRNLRRDGGVLMISLEYENRAPWSFFGSEVIQYTYHPHLLPATSSRRFVRKWELGAYQGPGDTYSLVDVHGIEILLVFTGKLFGFDLFHLFVAITTSVMLLNASHGLVDFIALRCAPLRRKYSLLKLQVSEDFSDFTTKYEIAKLKADAEGRRFLPQQNKLEYHSDLLFKCAQAGHGGKLLDERGRELLALLLMQEERLNRLDALDSHFVGDEIKMDNGEESESSAEDSNDDRKRARACVMAKYLKDYRNRFNRSMMRDRTEIIRMLSRNELE